MHKRLGDLFRETIVNDDYNMDGDLALVNFTYIGNADKEL